LSMEKKEIQTKKNEIRFTTSDPQQMVGKYLAANIVRTWKEDFVDETSGEVIEIERSEILFNKGTFLDPETMASVNFYLQSGDVKAVDVSNQKRLATLSENYTPRPFNVTAGIDGKNKRFILTATDIESAQACAIDHIELNYTQPFRILATKELQNFVILADNLRKKVEGESEDEQKQEAERSDARYYKIEADVSWLDEAGEKIGCACYSFMIRTKNVDTAKLVITAWINAKLKEKAQRAAETGELEVAHTAEIAITAASPFNVESIIEREFCEAYYKRENLETNI